MINAFFRTRKWAPWAWGGGLCLIFLVCIQVKLTLLLTDWRQEFGDLIGQPSLHTVDEYWESLIHCMYLVMPLVVVTAIVSYFGRVYAFWWREAIMFYFITRWRGATEKLEGESQRIQDDTKKFADIVASLGKEVISAVITTVAFTPLLWSLSSKVDIELLNMIPGSLFWIALVTGLGGTGVSWVVGIRLPKLQYNNEAVEAAFRKECVLAEDNKEIFGSLLTLTYLFTGIRFNYHRLFLHNGYVDLWLNSYTQIMAFGADVAMGPSLFTGAITLGTLTMVGSAFSEVNSSFSVFNNNWTDITELRAIRLRLCEFETHLNRYQKE